MHGKIFHGTSTIFLLCLLGYIQISNADQNCQYFSGNKLMPYQQWCPNGCCPVSPNSENSTCCNSSGVYMTLSTFTLFGYSWWTLFFCAICMLTAICILIHYIKRLHFLKHSKYFNSAVDPALPFTISKNDLDIKPNDSTVVLEQTPPSYTSSVSPPPPPPYASIHP